jgi:hypothetical protein
MAEQPNDFVRSLQELITNSASDQIRASRQFNELVQSIARGEVDNREANERIRQFLTNTTSQYINDLSRLTVTFFQALRAVNRHYSDHFFDQVMGESFEDSDDDGTLRRVDMPVSAVVGADVQRSFVIENRQDKACEVSFAVSEFSEVGGAASFRAPLQLQPARFTLRPGEEQVVILTLPLLPELFASGRQYEATVLVRGHDNLMLALSVDVQPHADVHQAERVNGVVYANGYAADDMTRLKGIGPNYQQQLAQAGIRSYADLARADEAYLQSRLGHAALRQAHRYNWQGQARLAAIGDEVGLGALKAKLPLANGKG